MICFIAYHTLTFLHAFFFIFDNTSPQVHSSQNAFVLQGAIQDEVSCKQKYIQNVFNDILYYGTNYFFDMLHYAFLVTLYCDFMKYYTFLGLFDTSDFLNRFIFHDMYYVFYEIL